MAPDKIQSQGNHRRSKARLAVPFARYGDGDIELTSILEYLRNFAVSAFRGSSGVRGIFYILSMYRGTNRGMQLQSFTAT